jgi:putative serine protease PepD
MESLTGHGSRPVGADRAEGGGLPAGNGGPGVPSPGGAVREPPHGPPQVPASRMGWRRYTLVILAACALTAAGGGAGAALALRYQDHGPAGAAASQQPASQATNAAPAEPLAKVAAAALPSVVSITVTTSSQMGEGSGVILRSDGAIVTNNHVIDAAAGGAGTIEVTFADGRTANAAIVGQDPAADMAVIRAIDVSGLTPATLGSVASLHVGDTVVAIGSPLGLAGSVTSGIVSALHRSIRVGDSQQNPPYSGLPGQYPAQQPGSTIDDVIQTDTAINPGNSGGALVDSSGRLVGITTAIATVGGGYIGQQSGSIGVGFAIPVDTAYRIATQLMGG